MLSMHPMQAAPLLALVLISRVAQSTGPGDSPSFTALQEAAADPALNLAPPLRAPAVDRPVAPAEARSWYGYQLMVSDVISLGILTKAFFDCPAVYLLPIGASSLAGCSAAQDLVLAGVAIFALMPAIIHVAHGQFGAAGGSLALRIALPIVLGLAFPPAAPVVLLVGVFIDDVFLSYEPLPGLEEQQQVAPAWPVSRDH
jgi:hypothetical protein